MGPNRPSNSKLIQAVHVMLMAGTSAFQIFSFGLILCYQRYFRKSALVKLYLNLLIKELVPLTREAS